MSSPRRVAFNVLADDEHCGACTFRVRMISNPVSVYPRVRCALFGLDLVGAPDQPNFAGQHWRLRQCLEGERYYNSMVTSV